jgi:hypothetical protein
MTPPDFETLLDRLGPRLADWPDPVRAGADALLVRSEAARELLARHLAFDDLFDPADLPAPPPTALIVARVLADHRRKSSGLVALWGEIFGTGRAWPSLAGLAACLVLGFAIGVTEHPGIGSTVDSVDLGDAPALELTDE